MIHSQYCAYFIRVGSLLRGIDRNERHRDKLISAPKQRCKKKRNQRGCNILREYRIPSNNVRTPKMCYPKREGNVMPILFWDNKFLGCGHY